MSTTKNNTTFTIEEVEKIKKQIKTAFPYVAVREEQENFAEVMTVIEIRLKHK